MTAYIVLIISVGNMQRYQQGLCFQRIKAIKKGHQGRFLLPHVFKDFLALCQLYSTVELSANHYIDEFGSMSNLI